MASYEATVRWRRGQGERFTDQLYGRAHSWHFDGGAVVPASSSPHVVRPPLSDPASVDPEEALVASLSSCHMLFFLSLAAAAGYVVESYEDAASGTMSRESGRIWLGRVTLRPNVVFGGSQRPDAAAVEALHHGAHERCYIANSVRTEIAVEGRAEGLSA